MGADRSILVQRACRKIEVVIENLIGILELLKSGRCSIDKEMAILLICKHRAVVMCDNVLLIFHDVVILRYMLANASTPQTTFLEPEEHFNSIIKDMLG